MRRKRVALGKALRKIRETELGGMTQTELADKIGCNPSYVGQIEAGFKTPTEGQVRTLAKDMASSSEREVRIRNRLLTARVQQRAPEVQEEQEVLMMLRPLGAQPQWVELVKKALRDTGEDVEAMATRAGVSPRVVQAALRGEVHVGREEVRRIAQALEGDEAEHLIAAGFVPDQGVELQDIQVLLGNQWSGTAEEREALNEVVRRVVEKLRKPPVETGGVGT